MWYNQTHKITFRKFVGDNPQIEVVRNSWADWRLIPTSKPIVAPPSVVEKYVDIPGRSGSLDVTTLLTGTVLYGNRKGSWTFYCMTDLWLSDRNVTWEEGIQNIISFLNGQEIYVVLDDDPEYEYHGRLKVSSNEVPKDYPKITIEYTLDPQRTHITQATNES